MAVFNETALVETPKPSAPLCSPSGIRFAQSVSTYCIKEQRTSKAIYVVEVPASGEAVQEPKLLIKDVRLLDIAWLNDEELLVLRPKGDKAHVDVTLSGQCSCDMLGVCLIAASSRCKTEGSLGFNRRGGH